MPWAILSPRMFGKTQWFLRGSRPISPWSCTTTAPASCSRWERAASARRSTMSTWPVHLQVQADALDEIERHATVTDKKQMWRMGWNGATGPDVPGATVDAPEADDVPALRRVCRWRGAGESPDFFFPSMVTDGVFFGVYEGATAGGGRRNALVRSRRRRRGDRQRLYDARPSRAWSRTPRHQRGARCAQGHRDRRA